MRTASTVPLYGLNAALEVRTVEPPVPQARAWAASYPASASPLRSAAVANGASPGSTSNARLPLLNLAQGVPGQPPHPKLLREMVSFAEADRMEANGYGPVFGHPTLRTALADDLSRRYKGKVREEEVAITSGGNLAAGVTFHALASPGDAIVLPTPWYFNHEMTLSSLSIEVLPLETNAETFEPDTESLLKLLQKHNAVTSTSSSLPRIKAMVLVTPNNPTGRIYKASLIRDFAKMCSEWQIALIVDETYRDFLLEESSTGASGDEVLPFARPHDLFDNNTDLDSRWQDTVISLQSFSKSYAIPGHRLGAIIAHPSLLITESQDETGKKKTRFGSLAKSLDNLQICPPVSSTQRAVAAAITDEEQVRHRLDVANDLGNRRAKFFASLDDKLSAGDMARQLNIDEEELRGLGVPDSAVSPSDVGWKGLSAGGYYAYVRHPFADAPSEVVARGLAALVGVVVLPGSFFRPTSEALADRDIRISIANVDSKRLDTLAARLLLIHALWTNKGIEYGL